MAATAPSTVSILHGPARCRVALSAVPHFPATNQHAKKLAWLGQHVLPPPAPIFLVAPRTVSVPLSERPHGYSPPLLLSTGPSRAPPLA